MLINPEMKPILRLKLNIFEQINDDKNNSNEKNNELKKGLISP
jgi:hypothetical protein